MKHPPTCGEPVKIKNAQPDSYMFGNIAKNAKFSIGSQHLCWDVIIADISDDLLLGLDFLKAHEGKVDFKNNIHREERLYYKSVMSLLYPAVFTVPCWTMLHPLLMYTKQVILSQKI